MDVFVDVTFEAAHKLPEVVPGHKCCRLHGHSFHVRATFGGPVQEPRGWVQDFDDLILLVKTEVYGPLDHNYLNDVPGLENPTSENIARWCWCRIVAQPTGKLLKEVQVRESCTTGVVYRGDEE